MKKPMRSDLIRGEYGGSLVELWLVLPLFLILAVGAVDFGFAFYRSMEIAGAAQAAALYASQYPTDTTGMTTVAQDDAPDVPNLTVGTPTYGCECSDGTNYSANCAVSAESACTTAGTTEVCRVNVSVSGTYTSLIPWLGFPSTLSFSNTASARSTAC